MSDEALLKKGAGDLKTVSGNCSDVRIEDRDGTKLFVVELENAIIEDTLGNKSSAELWTLRARVYAGANVSPGYRRMRDSMCDAVGSDDAGDAVGCGLTFQANYTEGNLPGIRFVDYTCVSADASMQGTGPVALTGDEVVQALVGKTPAEAIALRNEPGFEAFADDLVSKAAIEAAFPELKLDEATNTYYLRPGL